jgi:hypothetical protein
MALVTAHQPPVDDRHVFDAGDERLLRHASRAAHPPPGYFRRPVRD